MKRKENQLRVLPFEVNQLKQAAQITSDGYKLDSSRGIACF
jgi:hypothetical protein